MIVFDECKDLLFILLRMSTHIKSENNLNLKPESKITLDLKSRYFPYIDFPNLPKYDECTLNDSTDY